MNAEYIGNKLRELRERSGLSAEEVSAQLMVEFKIDMNYRTLYNYEKGRSSPDLNRFLALCVIYKCSDVLYEFGYTSVKHMHKLNNPEEMEIAEKYRSLPEDSKDMIRGALGIEKRDSEQKKGIS